MAKSRILSGIQPTNVLHIGNYIGAIRQWVELQHDYDAFFCIVDLHAITVKYSPSELRENVRRLAAMYIASGIDPQKSVIFVQSRVSAHAELAWILNTLVQVSELERMTQFKDKAKQHASNINAGLFTYPVLMAADILLYNTDLVPVGEDQNQHVELARTLARRFNKRFGDVLRLPQPKLVRSGARIMALDDPTKKMSKSAKSAASSIALDDNPDVIKRKIRKAVTDSGADVVFDKKRVGLYNLLTLYKVLSGMQEGDIEKKFADANYGDFKRELGELVVSVLEPMQERYRELMGSRDELEAIVEEGTKKAKAVAEETLAKVYRIMGLG